MHLYLLANDHYVCRHWQNISLFSYILAWRHGGLLIPQKVPITMGNLLLVWVRWENNRSDLDTFVLYHVSNTISFHQKLNLFAYDEGISQRLQDIKDLVGSSDSTDSSQCNAILESFHSACDPNLDSCSTANQQSFQGMKTNIVHIVLFSLGFN